MVVRTLSITTHPSHIEATVKDEVIDPEEAKRQQEAADGKPKFIKRLEPTFAVDGMSVRFDCKVSGNPEPEVSW